MNSSRAHCHLLAEVLVADGIMTTEEREQLERTMVDHGLSEADRAAVRDFEGADGAVAALREAPIADRQRLVDELVEAALIDGKLTANETAAVKRIAAALGLD